jgi:hypothetical protein
LKYVADGEILYLECGATLVIDDNGSDPVLKEPHAETYCILLQGIVIECSKNTIEAIR